MDLSSLKLRTPQWLVATSAFLLSAALAGAFVLRAERQDLADARSYATDLAADHSQTLQRGIERALSATYAVAALVRQGHGQIVNFDAVATEMLPFYPGIAALALSPGGIITQVVPLAGNEKVVGFNQLQDPKQNREARLAQQAGKLTLAGPINLAQGGVGLVGRLPVFLSHGEAPEEFWGFTNVTLRFPQALAPARLSLLAGKGYAYELWRRVPETGERQTIESSGSTLLEKPVNYRFDLPNGQWTLSLAPVMGWDQSSQLFARMAIALLLSGLTAYLAWLLVEMKLRDDRLELEVSLRTAEILETQQQLQATLRAIPDLLFELDLDGRYHRAHAARPELLYNPLGELLGRTVTEMLPAEAAGIVMSALHEAREQSWSSGKQYSLSLADGEHWFELSVSLKTDISVQDARFVVLSRDVTASKQAEAQIRTLAHYDVLTGLPNRALLAVRCKMALSQAQRNGKSLAIMFLDLDNFKNINDALGHQIGDELLMSLAGRLTSSVREQDTVSRLGGDEFILVLPDTDANGAAHLADKLLKSSQRPFELGGHELIVTPSIGIALYPGDGADFETLSQSADAAMYRAKADGRNGYRFFTAAMQAKSDRMLMLENALRRALERDQMSLHYQPQVSLASGRIVGAEALLRWNHPELGTVSPAEFIPVAEVTGLILPIGEWVMRTAVTQLKTWMTQGVPAITMAVNLSSVQFRHADLPELVSAILNEAQLPTGILELELTEGVAMNDPLGAIAIMNNLHDRGVRMSIDDFGTGYSSLSYLKKFQVYKVKIDQSFVRDITDDPDDKAIVGAIISMASSLGMQTIAEGVETAGQLEFLQAKSCTEVQGYYFSKPLPPAQFLAFWREYEAKALPANVA